MKNQFKKFGYVTLRKNGVDAGTYKIDQMVANEITLEDCLYVFRQVDGVCVTDATVTIVPAAYVGEGNIKEVKDQSGTPRAIFFS